MRVCGLMEAGMVAAACNAALASTEEAWQEFRAATAEACLALLPEGTVARIEVNPFGTESAGIALLQTGEGDMAELSVCVMNKQEGTAELSGPFPAGLRLEGTPEPAAP